MMEVEVSFLNQTSSFCLFQIRKRRFMRFARQLKILLFFYYIIDFRKDLYYRPKTAYRKI